MKYRKTARPDKTRLFKKIWSVTKDIKGEWGVDAASADFVNRGSLFATEKYLGLDISEELLLKGLAKYPGDIAVLGDLLELQLPVGFAQQVVSSNTFSHFPDFTDRNKFLGQLVNWCAPDGVLVIEMPNDENAKDVGLVLREKFRSVKGYYYGSYISRAYNNIITSNKSGVPVSWAFKKPAIILSYLLGYLETGLYARHKKHALFICTQKNDQTANSFAPSDHMTEISQGLFEGNV